MKEKIKEKIINILVIVVMVVVANYPLYTSLKATAEDVNEMIGSLREEIAVWKHEIEGTQVKLEEVREDIVGTIDIGINSTNNVLNKVHKIDSDIDKLFKSVESIKFDVPDAIEEVKDQPVETIKDLFNIKG